MTIIAKLLVISLDDYEEDIYKQIISLFPEKNQVAVLNAEPIIQKDELQIFPKSRTVRKFLPWSCVRWLYASRK